MDFHQTTLSSRSFLPSAPLRHSIDRSRQDSSEDIENRLTEPLLLYVDCSYHRNWLNKKTHDSSAQKSAKKHVLSIAVFMDVLSTIYSMHFQACFWFVTCAMQSASKYGKPRTVKPHADLPAACFYTSRYRCLNSAQTVFLMRRVVPIRMWIIWRIFMFGAFFQSCLHWYAAGSDAPFSVCAHPGYPHYPHKYVDNLLPLHFAFWISFRHSHPDFSLFPDRADLRAAKSYPHYPRCDVDNFAKLQRCTLSGTGTAWAYVGITLWHASREKFSHVNEVIHIFLGITGITSPVWTIWSAWIQTYANALPNLDQYAPQVMSAPQKVRKTSVFTCFKCLNPFVYVCLHTFICIFSNV